MGLADSGLCRWFAGRFLRGSCLHTAEPDEPKSERYVVWIYHNYGKSPLNMENHHLTRQITTFYKATIYKWSFFSIPILNYQRARGHMYSILHSAINATVLSPCFPFNRRWENGCGFCVDLVAKARVSVLPVGNFSVQCHISLATIFFCELVVLPPEGLPCANQHIPWLCVELKIG